MSKSPVKILSSRVAALAALLCAVSAVTAPAVAAPSRHQGGTTYRWQPRPTGVDEQFRGMAAVSGRVAWVSGEKGSVLRTTDGGRTWDDVSPAVARTDGLALRDIEATDAHHAQALSIGEGSDSRILRTDDGGRTWRQVFTNTDSAAFYGCMAINSRGVGLAMSDPVDGYFRIARTSDGGRSWKVMPTAGMPKAGDNEFGFAASGTCLVAAQNARSSRPGEFWFATGGTAPRVFHTVNAGRTWTAQETPVRGGDSAGIYSIAFRTSEVGVAVGGDYTVPTDGTAAAATAFFHRPWRPSNSALGGYRSGVAYVPGRSLDVIAVGPTGSDVSRDAGRTWTTFDSADYDGIHCADDGACWASGPGGAVATLETTHRSTRG